MYAIVPTSSTADTESGVSTDPITCIILPTSRDMETLVFASFIRLRKNASVFSTPHPPSARANVYHGDTIAGTPKTVTFRAYYSPDDSMIAASGGDVMFLIDAKNLQVIDTEPVSSIDHRGGALTRGTTNENQ